MKPLLKINNSELSYRLNLNYNNVYSRLKMLLGSKASFFADIFIKSTGTTWYSDDDAEYHRMNEAPKDEVSALSAALNNVLLGIRKELSASSELSKYVDDILEIPDISFVFYRPTEAGYKFILAGWGCKFAHQSATDPNAGFIKRLSKDYEIPDTTSVKSPEVEVTTTDILTDPQIDTVESDAIPPSIKVDDQPKKTTTETSDMREDNKDDMPPTDQHKKGTEAKEDVKIEKKMQPVILRVLDQNNNPVAGEIVTVSTLDGVMTKVTSDEGTVTIGELPYGETFGVAFPNIKGNHEHAYEVEPNVEVYDSFVKKLVKYSPVLFVEDQNGNPVQDYKVKIVINGQDSIYDTGTDGVIQLPAMQEGQKFIAIDTANYANTEEYNISKTEAKTPYHFHIRRAELVKVGITVLDKWGNPIPKATVDLTIGNTPCQQMTGENGRAEFPYNVFANGEIPVNLMIKGLGLIKSRLNYSSDVTEYTIKLQDKVSTGRHKGFNWKWLSLIPLLLLLAFGGYMLYKSLPWGTPTMKEMETGVVLVQERTSYYVETGFTTIDGKPQRFFFAYDENRNVFSDGTFDESERPVKVGTGTGFLISEDGLIATNRHVADPIPPEEASGLVKRLIADEKSNYQQISDSLNDVMRTIGPLRLTNQQYEMLYDQTLKQQQMIQNYINSCDRILTLGEFKVKVDCRTSVAFVNSIIETWDDFIGCALRASGDPGGVDEKDVAIIQLKNKDRDVPKDAFIFTVPEKDLMDGDIPDDYDITVLGYNMGIQLADIKNGIHPQPQPGKITIKTEEYRIGYNASTAGGSSGSPVLNKKGQLVAVNNSGIPDTQGFNYGIRTKYLRELLDKIQGNKDKKNKK